MGRPVTCMCGICAKCQSRERVWKSRIRHGARWTREAREQRRANGSKPQQPPVRSDAVLDEESLRWVERQDRKTLRRIVPRMKLWCQVLDAYAQLYGEGE